MKTIENYLIRRFVCNIPTNQLNKIFPVLYSQIQPNEYNNSITDNLFDYLQGKTYPKNDEFLSRFKETKFYGSGDRKVKTKMILESIEENYAHKEIVNFDNLTIEHIMPQTLSEWWQNHLGKEWENVHDLFLHTIGNLTLTAYNTELSNDAYDIKIRNFESSHIELNKYFANKTKWTQEEIEERAEVLAKKAIEIWPYFGKENSSSNSKTNVTGTIPKTLKILGQEITVNSWRDVLENTFNTIADLEPEKFEIIVHNFPRYVGKDKNKFKAYRQLQNNYFIEVNLSAQSIQKICSHAIETIDLTSEDWIIEY